MSNYVYRYDTLRCMDGFTVAIKYIESMRPVQDEEDLIIDKLKDDLVIEITTISGKTHSFSTKEFMNRHVIRDYSGRDIALAVFDRWITFLRIQ